MSLVVGLYFPEASSMKISSKSQPKVGSNVFYIRARRARRASGTGSDVVDLDFGIEGRKIMIIDEHGKEADHHDNDTRLDTSSTGVHKEHAFDRVTLCPSR